MTISYRTQKKWNLVLILTLLSIVLGGVYSGLRMIAGLMPVLFTEIEHALRTAGTIGFCLGIFMFFFVYAERGAIFRRLGFVAGWLLLEMLSTIIIVAAITVQRLVSALVHYNMEYFTTYFEGEILFDTAIALTGFLVVTFFLQLRRLVGEGTMMKMMTGRYHEPQKEHRVYMFLDIKDSTAIAERLGDEKTHALITQVFFDADRLIAEYRGEVLSYNGDELVATWLEEVGLENGRCLDCYAAIISSVNEKSEDYLRRFGVHPEFWAGFHVGEVMVGECGDSLLSIVHIGDTPNTAARLEHEAKDRGLDCLVSSAIIERTALPKSVTAKGLGEISLRGHSHNTSVYAVDLV